MLLGHHAVLSALVSGEEVRAILAKRQAFVDCIHYYTDPCWLNDNRSFVSTSDRENQSNLFRYDLDTGLITQITD